MNYDASFLAALDRQPNKTIFIKLISLDFNEQPIEAIEGRATSGSINIDGASAVRRTCQISLVTDKIDISNYNWSLKTKFKVQIGVQNTITAVPKIIWFDQGVYVISSFSTTYSANSYTINISGKDKMCMLNGEVGGVINSSAVFDSYDQINKNGDKRIIKNPIKQIIKEIVQHYGKELVHNIIINDLDKTGMELLEYRLDTPLYLIRKANQSEYIQATLSEKYGTVYLDTLASYDESTIDGGFIGGEVFTSNGEEYCAAKIEFGETAGYREIDLVYPSDLIANAGETVTSVLDKIKNMLGDYEYFYDLDGRFVFQQKQTYVNTSWTPSITNGDERTYVDTYLTATPYSYNFSDTALFTVFNNTPNLANLKNDFTIWGKNKNDLAIHMRYAIDIKPTYYKSISVDYGTDEKPGDDYAAIKLYNDKYEMAATGQDSVIYWYGSEPEDSGSQAKIECADWREIIYHMQEDYYKYSFLDNFSVKVADANPDHYPTGTTGYEQYYIDIQGSWRYLYTPEDIYKKVSITSEQFDTSIHYIYKDNKYEPAKEPFDANEKYYLLDENYYPQTHLEHPGWRKTVYEAPSNLLFWFDFLDAQTSDLAQYSVPAIGIRSKVENDDNVKAIYYGDTPQVIFDDYSDGISNRSSSGYKYFNIPSYYNMFTRSAQGKSAKGAIDSLLYNHACCTESVSITSLPIYYLEPNTLIYICDLNANIDGEYIVSKMTIPLAYNGTMSITGTKVVQRLY